MVERLLLCAESLLLKKAEKRLYYQTHGIKPVGFLFNYKIIDVLFHLDTIY